MRIDDDRLWKRHVDQLRPCSLPHRGECLENHDDCLEGIDPIIGSDCKTNDSVNMSEEKTNKFSSASRDKHRLMSPAPVLHRLERVRKPRAIVDV